MQIEQSKFEDIVSALHGRLDGRHQDALATAANDRQKPMDQSQLTAATVSSALAGALSEHGVTIGEPLTEGDGEQAPGGGDFQDIENDLRADGKRYYRITHWYDIGNQDVFVEHRTGELDGKRVALYCWFKASEWFGSSALVSNLGVAAAMVSLYGFRHCATHPFATGVDLYSDAEGYPEYESLMSDPSLHREGLREALAPHVEGASLDMATI